MYLDTLTGNKLVVLLQQAKMESSRHLYLAGGSALALLLGHRLSRDLDWFSGYDLPEQKIIDDLKGTKPTTIRRDGQSTIRAYYADDLETSFIGQKALTPKYEAITIHGQTVNVARIEHIAAMKMLAILNRGYKRDFIDVYAITRSGLMTYEQVERETIDELGVSHDQIRQAIAYFGDADAQPMPERSRYTWTEVKNFFASM